MKLMSAYLVMFFLCVSSSAYSMEDGDNMSLTLLLQAVQDDDEKKVAQLLKDGTSLMEKGSNGMTVFHEILFSTHDYDNMLTALLVCPRKAVLKTVAKMCSDNQEDNLATLVRWHIKGLRRALVVRDDVGSIPFYYADSLWQDYLEPGSKKLVDDFQEDIKEGYNAILHEKACQELYA